MTDDVRRVRVEGMYPNDWSRDEAHMPWDTYEQLRAEVARLKKILRAAKVPYWLINSTDSDMVDGICNLVEVSDE
jgi:hypothetical protein